MSQVMKKGTGKEHEVCRTTPFRRVTSTAKKKGSEGPAQRRRRCLTLGEKAIKELIRDGQFESGTVQGVLCCCTRHNV